MAIFFVKKVQENLVKHRKGNTNSLELSLLKKFNITAATFNIKFFSMGAARFYAVGCFGLDTQLKPEYRHTLHTCTDIHSLCTYRVSARLSISDWS